MNNLTVPNSEQSCQSNKGWLSWFVSYVGVLILFVTSFTKKLVRRPPKVTSLPSMIEISRETNGATASTSRRLNNSMAVSTNSPKKIKVLVVENSPDCRRHIKNTLLDSNCDVVTAISSIDGLLCLKTGEFDTAFISLELPVMDGISLAEKFRDWQDLILFKGGLNDGKLIKSTLIVGLIEEKSVGMYDSEAIDVFVPLPFTKSTAAALLFPASNLSSKRDIDTRPRSPLGQDQIGLFSCFYSPCSATH